MAKLVDAPDLGSGVLRRVGSSPITRTMRQKSRFKSALFLCKLLRFLKRIKLRVSECNANWFVITQRTEATSLKANTAKPGGSLDRGGIL